ncbi:MAG: T9SS type A sorting domain-containing protein, partial [Caldithrix sp.]|nr:T9SS type A sorting domain-containing protein [Caldithrix sp.]
NVDDEDDLELIFGTMRRNLHVLKIDSTELEGFPKAFNLPIDQGVAVADINGDQQPEMIFGTFNGQLFAIDATGDTLSNFPLQLDMRLSVTPIVVETDTSLYIIAATNDQKILKINPQGTVKSLYQFNQPIVGSPAVQDLNGDGNPEIIVADESGMLAAVSIDDGTALNLFPIQLDHSITTTPLSADLDGDLKNDLIVSTVDSAITVLSDAGEDLPGFPAKIKASLNGSPVIDDIDADGDLEISIGGSNGLYVLDLKDTGSIEPSWNTYLANNYRTGYYRFSSSTFVRSPVNTVPDQIMLYSNYPNPFNSQTTIHYALHKTTHVELDIYNVLGQRVASLFSGRQQPGVYDVKWDAGNMASGIYIYRLYTERRILSKRMLLIR